jgi:hypothetical protein
MINRTNWKLVREYLKYRSEVDHISKSSQRLEESWLRHLLEWSKELPFDKVLKIRPTFPEYVLTARIDGSKEPLSPVYVQKVIRSAYRFLKWLRVQKKRIFDINSSLFGYITAAKNDNRRKRA